MSALIGRDSMTWTMRWRWSTCRLTLMRGIRGPHGPPTRRRGALLGTWARAAPLGALRPRRERASEGSRELAGPSSWSVRGAEGPDNNLRVTLLPRDIFSLGKR